MAGVSVLSARILTGAAFLVAAGVSAGGLGRAAEASAFATYGASYRPIAMPATEAGSFGLAGDALPDGRIAAVTGNSLLLETGVGTGVFETVAFFDASQSGGTTDPAFVRVSPDGTRIAVGLGDGKPVAVVPVAALGTAGAPATLTPGVASYYNVAHYAGAWADNGRLALTAAGGASSYVSMLDTSSPTGAPVNPVVISGIAGASAGIAFDSAGRLYTGNGFAFGGPSVTGTIRAFAPAEWQVGGGGAAFETGGVLIGDVLSAVGLTFDSEGNLFVGGGDFGAGDTGYVGVISAGALAAALAGGGPINTTDPLQMRRLDPLGDPFAFYGVAYNAATGEVYVTYGDFMTGANTWFATIPSPSAAGLLAIAGVVAARRRRDA